MAALVLVPKLDGIRLACFLCKEDMEPCEGFCILKRKRILGSDACNSALRLRLEDCCDFKGILGYMEEKGKIGIRESS